MSDSITSTAGDARIVGLHDGQLNSGSVVYAMRVLGEFIIRRKINRVHRRITLHSRKVHTSMNGWTDKAGHRRATVMISDRMLRNRRKPFPLGGRRKNDTNRHTRTAGCQWLRRY